MATEAHTTEPVALLERGANNQLTAAEFNQPAEIANYLVKSENVKTSIDAVVESGIKGNAGAPEGGSFFESPTVVKVLVVKEIQQNEDLDAAEGAATKDNGVADETKEIEGKGITNNETVEVKNEYADAVANVQDLAEEKQTGGSEQNEEEGKTDESVEQETIREVSGILEASLGQTNEAVIDTNEQKLNDSDYSVDKITDGIENERKDAATSTETEVIEERSLGMAISINQNDNREVEVIENKINEPPVLLSTVEDELELTSVACKEEHEETEILDKTGEADGSESVKPKEEKNPEQKFDDLVSKHEEGKQSVIKQQISSDASPGEGRDENVHTVIAAEENITEVAAPEEMPSPKENLIQKDEPENEKIESSEKVSKETETAASNEIKNQEDCIDEAKEEKSNDTDIISDSGIPNEEISPPTTLDEKAKNADVERENKNADDRHPTRSLEQEITLPEGKKLEKSSDFKHQELVDNESGVSIKEETTPKLVSETTETGDEKLESPTVVKVLVVKEIQQNEDLDAAEGAATKDNGVADETKEIEGKGITNNETVEVKNEYADAVANVQDLAEEKQTGGSEQNEEEGKTDESVEQETIREVSSILEASLGQTNEAVIDTNEQKLNDSDYSVDKITDGIENERKDAATSTETEVIEERSLGMAISINQNDNREVEVIENKINEPPVLLSTVEDELELTSVACKKENLDIQDAGKNMEEGDLQVEISATSSNDTESKDEEKSVFNDNIVERSFEPENIQEAETKLQAEVGEDVKEKIPEENVESNSQESVDEDQTEVLQSDDKMTGQSSTENFEEHGTARIIDNVVKETNQIDGITNLTEQECLQSENRTLAVEPITNVKEGTDKEGPREDIKDKDQSRELSEEIASKDDIIEVQEIIQTMGEAEDTGKQESVVEDKIEVIAREMHEDPLQEEKGDDLDSTKLKEEIEDSKTEFTESIEERGYVEERESETLKDNEEPNSELTPAKASEETMLQKDVNESLAKIPTLEPESKEETLEREKYDIDDSNNAPTTTKETILEEGESEDKVEMQSSNLARGKEPIEMGMESDKLHQMDVDAESENATNLDGSRDPEIAVVENEVEEQIEHEIQTEAPIEGTEDQATATASETPSAYMSDDILKECSTVPSQESEFVSNEASDIVDEDAEEKSKTNLTEVVEEEKAGTYNNELEAADTERITQQECASKTMTGEESQEIICDTNQSELGEKMTDFKNESSEFDEQKSQEGHHETQEKEEPEEPRDHVKETQDADEIVKAVILTEEVQDVEEADGEDKTVKLANEEKEVIKEPHNELTEAESGEKAEESISTEQSKASDFNEQRETVSSDVQEASVMENEILIAKQTEVKQEQDEASGKSTGDSSTAAVQQSEEMKREITEGADSPRDKIKEITTSETSLDKTQIDEKTAQASNTTEDESSIDTVDVEASQQDNVVNRIAVEENSSNLASQHLAENNENATEEQIEDADADVAEERKKASDVDAVHESVDHYVEDVNAGESKEEVKEDSETVFKSRNIEALEKCEVSADQTVTEKRTKEELTPSPEIPSKEEEYETKTVQNEEESTKEVGIVYESSVKSSASNSTNETCMTKEEHREVCVSELGLDSPNEVHEENKGTLDEKVEVKETSETATLSNSQCLEAAIEHVVACDQTFHEDKGQEHEEVCIQTNESRELEASQPSLEFNEDKKEESQDETDEKKEAPGVISEASLQTLSVQRIDGQNQTSSELLSEEQEDGISASMDVVAEEEISSDQTLLTEKLKEQKETLSEQEHVASATIESEESSKEMEVVVVDDETKTAKEVSLQMEVPEEHQIQKESPKEVREDEDSGESREDIKEAAGLSSWPDSQDLKAPKEDETVSDTTLVTEEKSEAKSQTPSDAMIDETPATSEHIEQHTQEGENIEKSACFSTEGTKEVEALEVEIEKVNVNEVSNKDGGTPEEVLKLQPHENPSNDVEREVITGSEVQSYEKTRESEESEVKEKHLVAALPDFVQTNQPKETVDATDVAGNEIINEEVADKKEEWESSSPVTLNEETAKESSQLHELTAEERLGDDMIEKEIQNKKESGAEISDVKETVGEVEISSDENLPIAKSGEPSEIPSAQEKPEEYVEVTTKEVEVVEDESSRTESVSLPKEGDTKLDTCHSKCPLDAEEQKEAPKEVHEEEDIAPAETREEIKKDVECESVPNSDSQGFESTKDEIVSGDTLATGKTLEEKSKTPSGDLVSQITTLLEETEDQAKPEETQGDNKLQTKEQEFQELALEKESKEEGEVPDEAFKLESQENQTVIEEREFLTKNEEVVGLSKETSNLKTNISEETSKSEIYGSEVKDTQREEAITNDTTESMLKEVINEGITEDKDDAKGTPLIIGSDVTTKECHQEPEEKLGESLGDQKTTEEPQTEEEVDTEISNAKDAVEDDTITTDKSLPVAKLDEIQSVALLSEEQKQGTSGTTDFIKEVKKGVEGTEEPKATEEVPLQKEEPSELGVSQVETQLDKYVLETPKEVHEGEATTKQMDVIGDVPVIMEEASWQKEEPRGPEISESKRPLDADVQMDSQKEIHEEEDSAPIETKEEIKEQEVGTEILDTEEAVKEDKITSDKSLPASELEDEKEIQSVALFSEEQKHVTSATTECIKEAMKGVEGTEDEPKTTEEVPLQKEEPGELGLSQLEDRLEIYIEETPKEVHEGETTTKKVEMIGDVPNIIEEASLQKEEPRGAEISESKQLLDADVQMDSQKEVHEEEENALIETKEEIKEEEVSTEISESKEAVEDKNTSDKSLPFAKLEEQNEIQSVALLSEEQKQGTSATTDCIKEVTKGVEGTEVEPKTTEEVPLWKEEPRELEVFQEETQLDKYVQETLKEVHEGEATTKEVEVIGGVPNIMEEASLQKEEPKEPEISESYRLLDADVKMDSQNEVHAEEKSSPIKTEEEVESKSMSNSDSQVFEAPKEDKITSAETLATEEKSEEQSQIPFAALVSETTPPSEKEEQEKAVETPEDDNVQNSATPNDLEVQGLVLDKDQSLEEEKTQDEAVKLASEENKTNIKDEKSLQESERVTEIVGLPEGTANIKNEISEETLESESEIHSIEVVTEPGKTETKEEEAIATKIVDNEVINDEVAEDKDALTVSEVTTTECHQEPQPNLDESLKDKTIEELQTKEDFCTEKSDAKEEIVEEKVTSDKSLLMARSEGKIQIQPAALRLEEQTQGASATIESRKEATEDIEGIIDEPKTTEEVPLRKEAHSDLEGSKLETPVRNCILESPKEIQQEESEVTGKTREGKKGASETPLKSDSNEIEDKSDSNSKEISAALASKTTTILEKIEDPKREVQTPGNENPQISKEESKETEEGEVPGEASKLENQESKSKTTHAECPPQPETTSNLKAEQTSKLDSEIHSYEAVPKPVETEIIKNLSGEEKTDMQQNTIDTVKVQQINLTDEQVTESKQGTIIESQQKYELKPENKKAAKDIQNEKVEKSQEEERKTANAISGDKKTSEAEERGTAEGKFSLQDMLEKSTRQWPHAAEETEEAEKARSGGEEEDAEEEQKKCDSSGSDAPVMVEAFREMEIKTPHKKSLLSGVGSKVKHSISKVKKAITGSGGGGGKSSSQAKQQHSPK